MAKVGLFLRGARGKLAGSVLSKGETGTIIRENVVPANPRTGGQMVQRVAFATVASAAKYLLPVIGQTFEGTNGEKRNRRAFIKANVNKIKKDFIAFNNLYGDGVALTPDTSAAVAKGMSVLVPNGYVISKGALQQPDWATAHTNEQKTGFAAITRTDGVNSGAYQGGDIIPITDVLALMGLMPGCQVTVNAILVEKGNNVAYQHDSGDFIRYSKFKSVRVVITDDEDLLADNAINLPTTGSESDAIALIESLEQRLRGIIDTEKSDTSAIEGFIQGFLINASFRARGDEQSGFTWVLTLAASADPLHQIRIEAIDEDNYTTVALGAFISKFDGSKWAYSNSYLKTIAPGTMQLSNNQYYGLRYPNAWTTFNPQASSISDLYTRRGGSINIIGL